MARSRHLPIRLLLDVEHLSRRHRDFFGISLAVAGFGALCRCLSLPHVYHDHASTLITVRGTCRRGTVGKDNYYIICDSQGMLLKSNPRIGTVDTFPPCPRILTVLFLRQPSHTFCFQLNALVYPSKEAADDILHKRGSLFTMGD